MQYELHHVANIDLVPTSGEVEKYLSPRPSMADGTVQQQISGVEEALSCDTRYLGDTGGLDYDEFEQTELDVGVPVVREQAEITDYNNSMMIASD